MLSHLTRSEHVEDTPSAGQQVIGNDLSVAPPRHRLGAHDCCSRSAGKLFEPLKRLFPLLVEEVIGVRVESFHTPATVGRVGGHAASSSTQFREMHVCYPPSPKLFLERFAAEVREFPGGRESSDVDYLLDSVFLEQTEKLIEPSIGMADRENLCRLRWGRSVHSGFCLPCTAGSGFLVYAQCRRSALRDIRSVDSVLAGSLQKEPA